MVKTVKFDEIWAKVNGDIRDKGMNRYDETIVEACTKDAVYYRSLPLVVGGVLVTLLTQRSRRRSGVPFSPSPLPLGLAMMAGYLIGKFSYVSTAKKRVADSLSQSKYAENIRKSLK
ncbi:hypothetical protein HDE_05975 [Halotydeus destructor]|nr:hypothetical protein HDE_05975 [Halotydeus destructor]